MTKDVIIPSSFGYDFENIIKKERDPFVVFLLKQCVQCEYSSSENVSNTSVSLEIRFKLVFVY
jgi:hypothetical protein